MDWSNDVVLQFIELLEGEPCIWNSKSKLHKNKNLVNDAWTRIRSKMTVPCTIEDLKKKRNTLLTQYREYLKKIKDSTITGSGAEEIYRPSWFAFDAIHSYMGPMYDYQPTLATETQASLDENHFCHEENMEDSNLERPLSRDTNITRSVSRESNSRSEPENYYAPKRQRGAQDLLIAKKQMDEAFSLIKNRCKQNEKETNECDLYGQLLAQKLKTLDFDDRLVLMNEIDNIVFKYVLNARKRSSLVSRPSIKQTQRFNCQPTDSPGPSVLLQSPVALQRNEQNSQSILSNYDMPLRTSTPFETETQASLQKIPQNSYAIQVHIPESHMSPESSVANYSLYTANNNINYDFEVASTSKDTKKYKESKVPMSPQSSVANYSLYTANNNINYDFEVASTSKDTKKYKESKVPMSPQSSVANYSLYTAKKKTNYDFEVASTSKDTKKHKESKVSMSPQSSVANYSLYTENNNINYDFEVANTSKDTKKYKESKVPINILSQSVIRPGTYNIIEEAYMLCGDDANNN